MSGFEELFVSIAGENPVVQGLVGGIFIVLLNLVGALVGPAVIFREGSSPVVFNTLRLCATSR